MTKCMFPGQSINMSDAFWSMFIVKLSYDAKLTQCDADSHVVRKYLPTLMFVCRRCPSFRTLNKLEARYHLECVHPHWEQAVRSRCTTNETGNTNPVSSIRFRPTFTHRGHSNPPSLGTPSNTPTANAEGLRKRVVVNFHITECAQISQLPVACQSTVESDDQHTVANGITTTSSTIDCDATDSSSTVSNVRREWQMSAACQFCGVRTRNPSALQRHIQRKHPQSTSENISKDVSTHRDSTNLQVATVVESGNSDDSHQDQPSEISQDHVCKICGRTFSTKSGLSSHGKLHRKYAKLTCALCKKEVTCMSSLRHHCITAHDILLDLVDMPRRRKLCTVISDKSTCRQNNSRTDVVEEQDSSADDFSTAGSVAMFQCAKRPRPSRFRRGRRPAHPSGHRRGAPRLVAMPNNAQISRRKIGRPSAASALRRNVYSPKPLRVDLKPEPDCDPRYRSILPKPSDSPTATNRTSYSHASGRSKTHQRAGRTRQHRGDDSLKPLLCESFPASELFPPLKKSTALVDTTSATNDRAVLPISELLEGIRDCPASMMLTQESLPIADPASINWALGAVSCCHEQLSASGHCQLSSQMMVPNANCLIQLPAAAAANSDSLLLPHSTAGESLAQSYSTTPAAAANYCCYYYYYPGGGGGGEEQQNQFCPTRSPTVAEEEEDDGTASTMVPGLSCEVAEATELQAIITQPQQFVYIPWVSSAPDTGAQTSAVLVPGSVGQVQPHGGLSSAYLPDFFQQIGDVAVGGAEMNTSGADSDLSQDMITYANLSDLCDSELEGKQHVEVIDLDRSPFREAGVTSTSANLDTILTPESAGNNEVSFTETRSEEQDSTYSPLTSHA